MSLYINNIVYALVAFPAAAALFTLPYVIWQYRRYGSISLVRTLIIYSLILYGICAYFMVILPLPSPESVAALSGPTTQLVPFTFIGDMFRDSGLVISNPSTYLAALRSAAVLVVAFNVLLLLPLGVYLRYYFQCNWYQTLFIVFAVSLFFELTQLSGLYGIYERAYRLFDVDDLMLNTLGGMCGFWLAPLFAKILPSRERMDERSYARGRRVTLTRRFVAMMIDNFFVSSFAALLPYPLKLVGLSGLAAALDTSLLPGYIAGVLLIFFVFPLLSGGYTPGKFCVGLRLRRPDGGKPRWRQYLVRYGLLYLVILPLPGWAVLLVDATRSAPMLVNLLCILFVPAAFVIWVVFAVHFFRTGAKKRDCFTYARLSGIVNTSTVHMRCPDAADSDAKISADTPEITAATPDSGEPAK